MRSSKRPRDFDKIPPAPPEGSVESFQKFWQGYFNSHEPAPSAVAELVQQLYSEKRYEHAIAVMEAALLAGQRQLWMYDVLALGMELAGRPKADVERALLSRLDFAAVDVASTLFSAAYLTRFAAKTQALKLYRQAADLEPTWPESYVLGLRLAREQKDFAAVQWAAVGILQSAWNKDYERLHRDAEDAALEAERALRAAGNASQADTLRDAMAAARVRDLSLRLEWAGDADLDLSVEEPGGAIVSVEDPQSRGGGVYRHDGYGPDPNNCHEEYICAAAAPGVYVARVRRVDGKVVGNRARLTVIRRQGASDETSQTFVLKFDRDIAAVRIPLPNGRRRQLVPARPIDGNVSLLERLLQFMGESPAVRQVSWRELPASRTPEGPAAPGSVVQAAGQTGAGTGLFVPYQPIVEFIPQGVSSSAAAVISNDLRYVRIAVNPSFSTITNVFTFTFAQTAP